MSLTAKSPRTQSVSVRVFTNGGSQAVTIPSRFRLATKRATVSRRGDQLIITPAKEEDSWNDCWDALKPLDDSFRRWPTVAAEVRESL